MPFDSSLPANNSPLNSAEMRGQLNGLQSNIQAKAFEDDCAGRLAQTAKNPLEVALLNLSVSDPPTQLELQTVADKVDELILVLQRV